MNKKNQNNQIFSLLAFSAGIFCIQLDTFALNLALPQIGQDLHATAGWLKWIVSAYLLTVGTLMLATGRMSDQFGHRKLLIIGLFLFGMASLICALASSMLILVLARMLQGAGGACIMPAGLALLSQVYSSERKGKATGLAIGIGGIAMLCGPFVGGILTETYSWRVIFWLNVPIAIIAIYFTTLVQEKKDTEKSLPRLDIVGLVLITVSLALLSILIDQYLENAILSKTNILLSLMFIASIFCFSLYEGQISTPLIDVKIFQNRDYLALLLAGAMTNTFTVVYLFIIPLSFEAVWGLPSRAAGMAFFIPALCMVFGGPIAGQVRTSSAVLTMGGCLSIVAMTLFISSTAVSFIPYLILVTVCAAFLSIANALTLVATQAVVHPNVAGTAMGITKTVITIAAGLGVVLAGQSADQAAGLSAHSVIPGALFNLSIGCFIASAILYFWVFFRKKLLMVNSSIN